MIKKFEEFINESYGHNLLQELYKNANPGGKKLLQDITKKELKPGLYLLLCDDSKCRDLNDIISKRFDVVIEGPALAVGEFNDEVEGVSFNNASKNPTVLVKDFNRLDEPVFKEILNAALNQNIVVGTINVDDDYVCDCLDMSPAEKDRIQIFKI